MTIVESDTIIAVSTPAGSAHRGIVRLSGNKAVDIISKIFISDSGKSIEKTPNFTALPGVLQVPELGRIKTILFLYRSPTSYTKEDIVELHIFGSPALLSIILSYLLILGARLAEPGEFTKRAFLSGRIDLARAESVAALIMAQNSSEIRNAAMILSGGLSKKIKDVANLIRESLAQVEVSIDFSDQDIQYTSRENITGIIKKANKILSSLSTRNRAETPGVRVAICGAPNVGKSSLFNLLVGKKRSITSSVAGTTRDTVSENVKIENVDFTVMDCAGEMDAELPVDTIAAHRMRQYVEHADVVVFVTDSSIQFTKSERNFWNQIKCKKIFVRNKIDLLCSKHSYEPRTNKVIKISCLNGAGIKQLKSFLAGIIKGGEVDRASSEVVANMRQKEIIVSAKHSLNNALKALKREVSEEFIALDLRHALTKLSGITGESVTETVLDTIFSNFCIGK
ncbi:MAG: tRNA uridine-5-carboxymethylaminomethyl(34) synthesis GTPase MnmE [Planctomycetota bacterium]